MPEEALPGRLLDGVTATLDAAVTELAGAGPEVTAAADDGEPAWELPPWDAAPLWAALKADPPLAPASEVAPADDPALTDPPLEEEPPPDDELLLEEDCSPPLLPPPPPPGPPVHATAAITATAAQVSRPALRHMSASSAAPGYPGPQGRAAWHNQHGSAIRAVLPPVPRKQTVSRALLP